MKNFTIILFIFFIAFLILSLFVTDLIWIFLTIFLALVIVFICLNKYLGFIRGFLLLIMLIVLPFMLEYVLWLMDVPLFSSTIIDRLSFTELDIPVNLTNLFYVFTVPLLFASSLFFAKKIKIFTKVKSYHNTFLILASTVLSALNFLMPKNGLVDYQSFLKWLILALISFTVLVYLYNFKPDIPEIYKELPIILYLALFGTNALKATNTLNTIMALLLIAFYLIILYKEYKIRKLAASS